MKRHLNLFATVAALVLSTTSITSAAITKVMDFDVNDPASYNAGPGTLTDLVGGHVLTPGSTSVDANHAPPVYHPSGAGPTNRAFFDFDKRGYLFGNTPGGELLNVTGSAQGYTIEAYLRWDSDFGSDNNGVFGGSPATNFQNQLFLPTNFDPAGAGSSTNNLAETAFADNKANPNSFLPRDVFFHLVKTSEVVGSTHTVRYYVDGALVLTDSTIDQTIGAGAFDRYPGRGERYGIVAEPGRDIGGMGYSFFRIYTGTATDTEVAQLNSVLIPEPSSLALATILLGLAHVRRRPARA